MARSRAFADGDSVLGIPWLHIFMFGAAMFFFTKLRDTMSNLFSFKSAPTPEEKEETARIQKNKNQATRVPVNLNKLDRPLAYYDTFANILFAAMDGVNTDKSKVSQLFEHSTEELKQIYKAFGVRKNTLFGFEAMTGNLVEWLEYELNEIGDGSMLTKLRQHFANTGLW